jgi:NDP-sugar pyrophosphorylase family protein
MTFFHPSTKINAGLYILNPSVLDMIPCSPCSIEKEASP